MFKLSFIPTKSNHTERLSERHLPSYGFPSIKMTLDTSSVVVMSPLRMSSWGVLRQGGDCGSLYGQGWVVRFRLTASWALLPRALVTH